jgi:ATPase subunit of ABC transporter with duplicated ATPase domains
MAMLRAVGITVSRGAQLVLSSVDVLLSSGRRVGVVGPNGVGKSTLLDVLAGVVTPDAGTVRVDPPAATVGYLRQEAARSEFETVDAMLARVTGVAAASAALETASAALASTATGAAEQYDRALERWLALGAADLDARIGTVWRELGLPDQLRQQRTASLSGGEAARAGLAALMLSRFDVYLLDEPTNDLDLDGLERLERWIGTVAAPIALVSHDRTFLERSVTHVVELDEFSHSAREFAGGWPAYLHEREAARRLAQDRYDEFDATRRSLAQRAQREREWASQGLSKVRKSSERDKHIRAFRRNQAQQLAGRAAHTKEEIDRLEVVEKPREPWQLRLTIGSVGRSGDLVAELRNATVERDGFRLGPIDIAIGHGERVALLGSNGSGKSTLVDALLGRAELAAGRRRLGPSVVVGEIEQARGRLVGAATLLDAFTHATGWQVEPSRTLLAKFGLIADHVTRPTDSLSPGERTRALLALLMANGANLLALDEPTNHLDVEAIEQLEVALDAFAGTIVLVTHDRTMLERVRLTRRVTLADGQVVSDVAS